MDTLFILVWLATLIAIPFWTFKYIKFKIDEKNSKGINLIKEKLKKIFNVKDAKTKKTRFTGKQIKTYLIISIVVFFVSFIGFCITTPTVENINKENTEVNIYNEVGIYNEKDTNIPNSIYGETNKNQEIINNNKVIEEPKANEKTYSPQDITQALKNIPKYSKNAYVVINNNVPFFNSSDLTTTSYESYSKLDSLGRCGVAIASIGKDIMPTEDRGNIGSVKPTGWHSVRYDGIDGNYLYNRCHLIGYQLTAENANEKNLITGTRYLNTEGMLPFENMVSDYIKETNNHVLYRVTPVFEDNNLLVSGVLIEAKSIEDNGSGIEFNVYCYNVQPGITINYATGESSGPEYTGNNSSKQETTTVVSNSESSNKDTSNSSNETSSVETSKEENTTTKSETKSTYILNTNTKKYHKPSCRHASSIKASNKQTYKGTSEELDAKGYQACKVCKP